MSFMDIGFICLYDRKTDKRAPIPSVAAPGAAPSLKVAADTTDSAISATRAKGPEHESCAARRNVPTGLTDGEGWFIKELRSSRQAIVASLLTLAAAVVVRPSPKTGPMWAPACHGRASTWPCVSSP